MDIESFNKDELVLKIKDEKKEKMLFAFNKKRITEDDLMKSFKRASERNLVYSILCLTEPPKKLLSLIEAVKKLSEIESLE